jgi:hypothetical protein
MDNIRFQNFHNLFRWFLLVFLIFSFGYGYLNTEILTTIRLQEFDYILLCKEPDKDLKFAKVIKYEKYRNTARLLCVYSDYSQNQYLDLNFKSDIWIIVSKEKVNTRYNFYWPIYL